MKSKPSLLAVAGALAAVLFWLAGGASAQERSAVSEANPAASAGSAVAQANNPLAKFTAFNVHNYYIGELTDPEKNANQVWLRYAQPFSIAQTHWLLRASLPCNFDNGDYNVPLGLGIGQVIPTKKAVFNIFIEPQVSVADKGAGWAKWQIFLGLNTQFK